MSKFRSPSHGRDHNHWGSDPVAGSWVDVGDIINGPSAGFQNSWDNVGTPYEDLMYRKGASGLEFQGHVSGGASGTVAFIVIEDHRPFKNVSFLTDVGDIGSFVVGRVEIDATTGEVTITFPAS